MIKRIKFKSLSHHRFTRYPTVLFVKILINLKYFIISQILIFELLFGERLLLGFLYMRIKMNNIIKKFGFLNEDQFLEVTKSIAIANHLNLNRSRYRFVKNKGFETVKSYLLALNKEIASQNKLTQPIKTKNIIDDFYLDFNSPNVFEKQNFKRKTKLFYIKDNVLFFEIPADSLEKIEDVKEFFFNEVTGTNLSSNIKVHKTMHKDIHILTGQISFKDIDQNIIEPLAESINSYFNIESGISDYVDELSNKIHAGYISFEKDLIDSKSFCSFNSIIPYESKKIIADFWLFNRSSNIEKNIKTRKSIFKLIIISEYKGYINE